MADNGRPLTRRIAEGLATDMLLFLCCTVGAALLGGLYPALASALVAASALGDRVELRIVDRGPGVPDEAKDGIFEPFLPFQRYGDVPRGSGVGLGLAVARGLTEAMGGTLVAEDTPGGGPTMVLTLQAPAARNSDGSADPVDRTAEAAT